MDYFTLDTIAALFTLTVLEIVLGVDNIVFLAILVDKLEQKKKQKARAIGLGLALLMRIILLLGISKIMMLTDPILTFSRFEFSGRDLIMLGGGLFLIAKATLEMHSTTTAMDSKHSKNRVYSSFAVVVIQIVLVDLIFSIDSVITAVGMSSQIPIMISAVVIAILVMLFFADYISRVIEKQPTLKVLALSFILLVGIMLLADAFDKHVPRGYLYFAMAFSLFVEVVNIRVRKNIGSV